MFTYLAFACLPSCGAFFPTWYIFGAWTPSRKKLGNNSLLKMKCCLEPGAKAKISCRIRTHDLTDTNLALLPHRATERLCPYVTPVLQLLGSAVPKSLCVIHLYHLFTELQFYYLSFITNLLKKTEQNTELSQKDVFLARPT